MKNVNQILKGLTRIGFRLEYAKGGSSTVKIFPPNPAQPFYTAHIGNSMLHPLRRFAKHNWGLDINSI